MSSELGSSKYKLDTETKGSTVFRNSRALGCSDPSAARALLRARGFLNRFLLGTGRMPHPEGGAMGVTCVCREKGIHPL